MDFSQRNKTIDIFRALTVFIMGAVNVTWMVGHVPHWIEHGKTMEDFLGLADFVFPSFIFAVGLSIPYALERRLEKRGGLDTVFHVLKRALALIIMGVFCFNNETGLAEGHLLQGSAFGLLMVLGFFLVWNTYPKCEKANLRILFKVLEWIGVTLLVVLAITYRGPMHGDEVIVFRSGWWGILGILGWTYLVAAFLYLALRASVKKFSVAFGICFLLCMLLSQNGLNWVNDTFNYPLQNSFMYQLLGKFNIPTGSELALCTAGILTSLVAASVKDWKIGKKAILVVSAAVVLCIGGILLHKLWIVSKNLATPPTVCFDLCIDIIVYSLIKFLVTRNWDKPFNIIAAAGTATLSCYFMQYVISTLVYLTKLPTQNLNGVLAVLYCFVLSYFCVLVTAGMEKLGIKLKI